MAEAAFKRTSDPQRGLVRGAPSDGWLCADFARRLKADLAAP